MVHAELKVDFAGEIHVLEPGDELTFGRASSNDIVIDDNPRLHRHFGQIYYRDSGWWLKNTGRQLPMGLLDQASRSQVTLTSKREISLTFSNSVVSFSAGTTSYELRLTAPHAEQLDRTDTSSELLTSELTIDRIPLVGDQRLLAIAMAELAIRNPHERIEVPPNRAIARRFGWPITTLNRKLDRLCRAYADMGVAGLVGSPGQLAADRRQRLVEHLISIGEITSEDLSILEEATQVSE